MILVREKSTFILSLLESPQKLDEERENYKHWKNRISSVGTSKSNKYGSTNNSSNNKYGSTSGDTGGSSFKNKYGSTSSNSNYQENKKNGDSRDYNPNVKRKDIKTRWL